MKRKNSLILLICILSLFIFLTSCGNSPKNYVLYHKVSFHYDESIAINEVIDGEKISFNSVGSEFILVGWYNEDYTICYDDIPITTDLDVYAKLVKIGSGYNITYDLDGGEFETKTVRRYVVGEKTELPKAVKNPNYEFVGWINGDGEIINEINETTYGDLSLKASFIDHNKYCKINYIVQGTPLEGNVIDSYRVGDINKLTAYPKKDGYYFKGWYLDSSFEKPVSVIDDSFENDVNLYPKFEEITKENTYISFFGDSITTFEGCIPEGFATYYPAGDVKTKEDTWWHKTVTLTGFNLLVNNSFSGSLVSKSIDHEYYGSNEIRVKCLERDGIKPDVVVIHMGTNDFTHGMVGNTFKEKYQKMIDLIKENYDDVKIYVCLLPSNTYAESFIEARVNNNKSIAEIASSNNLEVIDLNNVLTPENCRGLIYAGSHPNRAGMMKIAEYVANQIKLD